MSAQNISVILVDDSQLVRRMVREVLTSKGLNVIGEAKNGLEGVEIVAKLNPDIVLLDCEMPVMDGIHALRKMIQNNPDQKVIMFSNKTTFGAKITIEALEIGAVDFLTKPQGGMEEVEKTIDKLISRIKIAKFKRMDSGAKRDSAPAPKAEPAAPYKPSDIAPRDFELISIGSSTGGVKAALDIVGAFTKNFPPVVWVQHMPSGFTTSFAERLDRVSEMHFKEAMDGDVLERGCGYLAPGGEQIKILKKGSKFVISLDKEGDKVSGHKPSADALFSSISNIVKGPEVLAIILTGMGSDGANGLKMLHDKGSFVIGQDESSCVVYGMPKVAKSLGAVDVELRITDIPALLKDIVKIQGEN